VHSPKLHHAAHAVVNPADDPLLQDIDGAPNLVALFLKRADEKGGAPFLGRKTGGTWVTQSWRETAEQVCLIAEALRTMGLKDGDRVALVSENRPEWCIADLAIMAAGCITVPTYTTNTVEGFHRQILCVTKSKGAFSSETALLKLLYLTTQRIIESWKLPLQNWAVTLQQLVILFENRVREHITI